MRRRAKPKLLFAEEFDRLDLATPTTVAFAKWRPMNQWSSLSLAGVAAAAGDAVAFSFNVNPVGSLSAYSRISVANSVLTIAPTKTPSIGVDPSLHAAIQSTMTTEGTWNGTVPPWLSGLISVNRDHSRFRYGYFEIKARWPIIGKGIYPAIWLYGSHGSADPYNRAGAEIDILEIFGRPLADSFDGNAHFGLNSGFATIDGVTGVTAVGARSLVPTDWNLFGLDWQPGWVRWYHNNTLVGELTGAQAAHYVGDMQLILNCTADAPSFADYVPSRMSDGTTPDPLSMEVDYVRVYSHKSDAPAAVGKAYDGTALLNAQDGSAPIVGYVSLTPSSTTLALPDTPWSLTVTQPFAGANALGVNTAGPGGASSFTASAHQTALYVDASLATASGKVAIMALRGLSDARTYTVQLLPSRTNPGGVPTRNTRYTITCANSPAAQVVNAIDNVNTLAEFTGLQPSSGSIVIQIEPDSATSASFGYLNALRVIEAS